MNSVIIAGSCVVTWSAPSPSSLTQSQDAGTGRCFWPPSWPDGGAHWLTESPESCHSMRGADRPPTAPSGATDELDPAAFTLEEASLDEVLLAEHSRLLADPDDLNLVAERTTISVRRSTWSVAGDASEEDAALFRGAAPNRESAARIRAALARPVVDLDRLAVTRPDARLRSRSAELGSPEQQEHPRDRYRDQDRQAVAGARDGLACRRGRRRSPACDRMALVLAQALERDVRRRTPRAGRYDVRTAGCRGHGRARFAPGRQRRGIRRRRETRTRPRARGLYRGNSGGRYWVRTSDLTDVNRAL